MEDIDFWSSINHVSGRKRETASSCLFTESPTSTAFTNTLIFIQNQYKSDIVYSFGGEAKFHTAICKCTQLREFGEFHIL